MVFVSFKFWEECNGEENSVEVVIVRVICVFSQICDGLVFFFNMLVIVELGIVIGFDFELIDQGGFGYDVLIKVCN